jgi:hypothetical protein
VQSLAVLGFHLGFCVWYQQPQVFCISVEPLIVVRSNYIFFIVILIIVCTKSVIFPMLLTL